ncbi:MAG: hypothetical protein OIN87_05785 [Candidatus Methanoperedens sp.]|nr:hypothetical protein [Candidatus Methanoperedens sp.]
MIKQILLCLILIGSVQMVNAQNEPYPSVPAEVTERTQEVNALPAIPEQPEPSLPQEENVEIIKKLPERPKSIVMEYNLKDGKMTLISKSVVYGIPRSNAIGYDQFNVQVMDTEGKTIQDIGIMDPRVRIVEDGPAIILDDVNFAVSIPFKENIRAISIVNVTTKQEFLKVDIQSDIKVFLENTKNEEQETPGETSRETSTPRETQKGDEPDFFISIEPKSIDAKPGDTLDFRIKVTTKGGFNEPVKGKLIVSGPLNLSLEYELPEISPPYPKEFNYPVSIPAETISGLYSGKIIATGGGITKEDTAVARIPNVGFFTATVVLLIGYFASRMKKK